MKAKHTFQASLIALFLALGITSCKKDKTTEPALIPVQIVDLSIEDLKKLSTAASVTIGEQNKSFKLKGIVVSNKDGKNIDAKTVVLQQANDKAGIIVNFTAAQTFALGDEIQIDLNNQKLEKLNGEIILNAIPVDKASKTGTGTIAARATTIAEINTNKASWNGTLVSITATDLTSVDGKYKGSLSVKDASGTIISPVIAGAVFENTALPVSVSKVTGIVRLTAEVARIELRNAADVVSGAVSSIEYLTIIDQFGLIGGNTRTARAINPQTVDKDFTTQDLFYSYLFRTNTADQIKNNTNNPAGILTFTNGAIRPGAKEVTVMFAGSMMQGAIPLYAINDNLPAFTLAPFNTAQHNIKIGIGLVVGNNIAFGINLLGESPAYNEAGKFYSFKVKLPATAEELTALGMNSNDIPQWLENPKIGIYNLSTKRSTAGGYEGEAGAAPVLVGDKVAIGY